MPPHLYKYLPKTRFDTIKSKHFCFSRLDQINDPFEGVSRVGAIFGPKYDDLVKDHIYSDEGRAYIRKCIIETLQQDSLDSVRSIIESDNLMKDVRFWQWLRPALGKEMQPVLEYLNLNANELFLQAVQRLGAFCMTENVLSAPMWAHYAESYRGFAVKFNTRHEFFYSINHG